MKKQILIGLICLLTLSVKASSKESKLDTTINKITSQLSLNDSNKLKLINLGTNLEKGIAIAASKLKITVDRVWDIIVKQQLVFSYCCLFMFICTIFSWVHFWYRFSKGQKDLTKSSYGGGMVWKDSHVAVVIICGAMSSLLSIADAINFQDMITGFVNPEFGAMKNILEYIK